MDLRRFCPTFIHGRDVFRVGYSQVFLNIAKIINLPVYSKSIGSVHQAQPSHRDPCLAVPAIGDIPIFASEITKALVSRPVNCLNERYSFQLLTCVSF